MVGRAQGDHQPVALALRHALPVGGGGGQGSLRTPSCGTSRIPTPPQRSSTLFQSLVNFGKSKAMPSSMRPDTICMELSLACCVAPWQYALYVRVSSLIEYSHSNRSTGLLQTAQIGASTTCLRALTLPPCKTFTASSVPQHGWKPPETARRRFGLGRLSASTEAFPPPPRPV